MTDLRWHHNISVVATNVATTLFVPSIGAQSAAPQAPSFTSGIAPNGVVTTPYSFTLKANGVPTPTFSVTPNALPPGLALNSTSGLLKPRTISAILA